ncbi:serine hydrolase domain-containing protein [Streptomyces halobius]|uniref:Beta-lactamase family protein n=1 Tax=Streptomyces halobius TaxID=2879846 RepID=A0ABY4MAI5_9ACTN|nr:serine hydrolase domain-containing protein [Streptomyces halobius]UQA94752.1 beta-lactamase family protein [Streptomyces halobius]
MTMCVPCAASAGAARPAPSSAAARGRSAVRAVQAALTALALTACTAQVHVIRVVPAGTAERTPATTARALHQLVDDGAPGAASLITREGRSGASRFSTAGVADVRSGRRMGVADHFRAGSLTKPLVATVVLQLVAEGELSLSDTVAAHLPPGVPTTGKGGGDLRKVTIRQLLDHTSGLFNYTEDPRLSRQLAGTGFDAHRYDSHPPAELLRIALSHPPSAARGAPGAVPRSPEGRSRKGRGRAPSGSRGSAPFAYSNTNYLVLGLVIEAVTGHPYATEIRRRIPVGLDSTSFPGTDPTLPKPHGRAYAQIGDRRVDATSLDPSRAGAAGEMITTLGDLNRFFSALLGGRLLPPRQMAQLRGEKRADGTYGLGLYSTELPCGVTVWGHNGDINGSYVQSAGTADGRHLVSYRVNTDALTDPGHGTAVLTAEFCAARRRR